MGKEIHLKILVAPDKFKGSLSAEEAARAVAGGIKRAVPAARVKSVPLADGGEGTARILTRALKGRWLRARVWGPLRRPVEAGWGHVPSRRLAVLEMAEASGLSLVPPHLRRPLHTTTYGTGQLLRKALDRGCREILIGLGGSATVDGGLGMIQALGGRLLTVSGRRLPEGASGKDLKRVKRIDLSRLDPRWKRVKVRAACDVLNPLVGPRGAARVFGPQKGASPSQARALEAGLSRLAALFRRQYRKGVADLPRAGAAGGLGAALHVFLGASLESGIDVVIAALGLEADARWADLILTGEGRVDGASADGKTPAGVAKLALKYGKPLMVLAGSVGPGAEKLRRRGVTIVPVTPAGLSRRQAFRRAPELLSRAAADVVRRWR